MYSSSINMVGILECRTLVKLLVLCHLIFSVAVSKVEARIRHYRWEVKYEYKSPDCFKKLVITINGGTPGPKILAQQGDTVVVELKNSLLTENVAIHWHGIRQVRRFIPSCSFSSRRLNINFLDVEFCFFVVLIL